MRRNFVLASLFLALSTSLTSGQVREEWVARYHGPANYLDGATAMALDGKGNVYVTGSTCIRSDPSIGCIDSDYGTIKYDPDGNELWVARYNGPENRGDGATAMALDADGNVYVTGWSWGDYATIKYDTNGKELWVARYNGPANDADVATGIALDAKGNVYVTGRSVGVGTDFDYATVKYDPDGNEVWVARYNGPGNREDRAYGIGLDADGNAYVTGGSWGPGTASTTIKYDADGNELWVARYSDSSQALAIAVDARGNAHVTGEHRGNICRIARICYGTIKYDSDGNQLWVAPYSGPGRGFSFAQAIALDTSGNVYVTGESQQGIEAPYDYATVKYDSDGHQLWAARYDNGRGSNGARAIAIDADGNAYVTGGSCGAGPWPECFHYATVKYDPAGNQLWVARYNGPVNGNDLAVAIALDASANVYVTGESCDRRDPRSCLGSSYATIKYAQE